MKWLLLLIILFLSCSDVAMENPELPQFISILDAVFWIQDNIVGTSDFVKGIDKWQYWYETLQYKKGDCDDCTILLMYIAKTQFNKHDMSFIYSYNPQGLMHYNPKIDGVEYWHLPNSKVGWSLTWEEVQEQIPFHRF